MRVSVVGALLLSATAAPAALPGGAALAAGTPGPNPYAFAAGARTVTGATGTADAESLEAGATYKSSLPAGGKTYYRLALDARTTAYVSVTAVPAPGSTVTASAGIRVSVQDADGRSCGPSDTETFGSGRSPRPITAWGKREVSTVRPRCPSGGTYYVVVERVGPVDPLPGSALDPTAGSSAGTAAGSTAGATAGTTVGATEGSSAGTALDPTAGSSSAPPAGSSTDEADGAWDLELFASSEPPLAKAAGTIAPEVWDYASPEPLPGDAVHRQGGAGFASAVSVKQGAWRSDLRPGETVFYKVPVDWGRQLSATAELGSSDTGHGSVVGALGLSLYNPARGDVDDASALYGGKQKQATLDPLPPVAYENRYAVPDRVNGMRFAGSYYLAVHLAAGMAEKYGDGPFGVVLRVRVEGAAQAGPGYAGESRPEGLFAVAGGDPGTLGQDGTGTGGESGDGAAMKVLAVGGIGMGTALLVLLGVWTAVARRNAAQMRASAQKPTA